MEESPKWVAAGLECTAMRPADTPENAALLEEKPALFAALSPLGRRVAFPADIPAQAADARGKAFNATIGQITDGKGGAVALAPTAAALGGLGPEERNRAILYSPVQGIEPLRVAWRRWQRRAAGSGDGPQASTLPPSTLPPSTRPLVTAGLTHGLSIAADLFGGEGRAVAVPAPFWGNYRQTFANRTGAVMRTAPAYREGGFHPEWPEEALDGLPAEEPAVAIVNLPSNPGGYSPTVEERRRLIASLVREAERRPLVVLCDDAYAGLVYEPGVPRGSIFWELAGRHQRLVPVKIDGATKELSFFGGRVGFLTFAFEPESAAAEALESKVKCLIRAVMGSPVATSQMIVLAALEDPGVEAEVERVRVLLEGRYRVLREALAAVDRELLLPLPFNSGCFVLLELAAGVTATADQVRRHLLDAHDTGLVSIGERHLRIAFCSVGGEALPELVRRIESGVRELASGSGG